MRILPTRVQGLCLLLLSFLFCLPLYFFLGTFCYPLVFVRPRLAKYICEIGYRVWVTVTVASLTLVFDIDMVVTGDKIKADQWALVLSNHRCEFDWMFIWLLLEGQIPYERMKIVMKSILRHIPFIGWACQIMGHFFLSRRWDTDKVYIRDTVSYLTRNKHIPYLTLLFPEGTNLNQRNLASSNRYALKEGMSTTEYTLSPRVTGMSWFVKQFRANNCLQVVYDITIGYEGPIPEETSDLFMNGLPNRIHFHVRRFEGSAIPEDASKWCQELWAGKESMLEAFYRRGSFLDPGEVASTVDGSSPDNGVIPDSKNKMRATQCCKSESLIGWSSMTRTLRQIVVLATWTSLSVWTLWLIYASFYFKLVCLFVMSLHKLGERRYTSWELVYIEVDP